MGGGYGKGSLAGRGISGLGRGPCCQKGSSHLDPRASSLLSSAFPPRRILLLVPPFLFLKSLFLLSNMSTSGVLVLFWGGPHLCSRYVVWCPHRSAVHFVCILPPLPFSVSASLSFHLCALCLRKPVSVCHCFSWFPSQEGGLRGLECG